MSELINTQERHENLQRRLMVTVSALALSTYIGTTDVAWAQDSDRPVIWIELGGQMEQMQGLTSPFTAPFMSAITPTPAPYSGDIFNAGQKPSRFALGLEGKLTYQAENSDWSFSGSVRYGRSNSPRHIHHQTNLPHYYATLGTYHRTFTKYPAPFADVTTDFKESHTILDFSAGRDIGVGLFGRDGSSTLNAGVRFAQFSSQTTVDIQARPTLHPVPNPFFTAMPKYFKWDQYALSGHAERSFHGIGPSLSWSASAGLLGNKEDGELMLDWSVNVAALFGRQKAKTSHNTQQHYAYGIPNTRHYPEIYHTGTGIIRSRARSVTVPNVGGTIGLSVKYPNVKVSFGYRADFFFDAVDAGIDELKTKDLGFQGPFATVSVGLGG